MKSLLTVLLIYFHFSVRVTIVAQLIQTNGPYGGFIQSFAFSPNGTNIFAGTGVGGVFLTTDNGINWNPVNTGLTASTIQQLAFSGSNLLAATYGGIFLTTRAICHAEFICTG